MADIVTVDMLIDLLQKFHDAGNGDMKIKCRDNFLHEDEIGINYKDNEMQFRGYLFNLPIAKKVSEFCSDIEKAKKKFYGLINEEESEDQ